MKITKCNKIKNEKKPQQHVHLPHHSPIHGGCSDRLLRLAR